MSSFLGPMNPSSSSFTVTQTPLGKLPKRMAADGSSAPHRRPDGVPLPRDVTRQGGPLAPRSEPPLLRLRLIGDPAPATLENTGGPTSQAMVAGKPYRVDAHTLPVVRAFLESTLSHNRYTSAAHLRRRAEAHARHIGAEKRLIDGAVEGLHRPGSATFQQASWMGHLERGLWTSEPGLQGEDRQALAREALGSAEPEEGSPFHGPRGLTLSVPAKTVFAMMLAGEEGPFTEEQARTGFEAAQTGQVLAGRLGVEERVAFRKEHRLDAQRAGTHSTRTAEGMDLSADLGTRVRDAFGVPVMSGTSGSSSDAALSTMYGAQRAGTSWAAPGLGEQEAKAAIADLSLHYFRAEGSPPARSMARGMNAVREAAGLPPKEVEVAKVFTHSYPEVYTAVSLTLDGVKATDAPKKLAAAMLRSTVEAKRRLVGLDPDGSTGSVTVR
jgi:hypothetical protein